MKYIESTNKENWTNQEWPGNPSLNLVCSCKLFKNPFNGKSTPIWIFGGTTEYTGFNFCVNAGNNSDYSYTGRVKANELKNAEEEVNTLYKNKLLFK